MTGRNSIVIPRGAPVVNKNLRYKAWQNHATRFYLGSRCLDLAGLHSSSVFCGFQAIENLLKATLLYYDPSFNPRQFNHNMERLIKEVEIKVPGAKGQVSIQPYLYYENRYQLFTRYPDDTCFKIIAHFRNYLKDLDCAFHDLLVLVPYQKNTELYKILKDQNKQIRFFLRKNIYAEAITSFILKHQ